MNIKRTLKLAFSAFTLAACGTLLFGGGASAYADETETPAPTTPTVGVKLKSGDIVTWANFAKAINNPNDVANTVSKTKLENAQEAYNTAVTRSTKTLPDSISAAKLAASTAQKSYNEANDSLTNVNGKIAAVDPKNERVPFTWLTNNIDSIRVVKGAFDDEDPSVKAKIYAKTGTSGFGNVVLTLSFIAPSSDYTVATDATSSLTENWMQLTIMQYYNLVVTSSTYKPAKVWVFLGETDGKYNYNVNNTGCYVTAFSSGTSNGSIINMIYSEINALKNDNDFTKLTPTEAYTYWLGKQTYWTTLKDTRSTALDTANDLVTKLENALTAAQGAVTTAKDTLDAEKEAYNQAVADAKTNFTTNYYDVALTGNVDVDTPITVAYNGILDAANYIITNKIETSATQTQASIFNRFNGTLENAGVNGVFASSTSGATFDKVVYWPNNNTNGVFYAVGGARSEYETLGELGYAARNVGFGVNFVSRAVTSLTQVPSSKVYDITVYESANNKTQSYSVVDGTGFRNEEGPVEQGDNVFIVSANSDIRTVEGLTNVIYLVGSQYSCNNTVITDRTAFYSPVEFKAVAGNYNRDFVIGNNAVCVPFQLDQTEGFELYTYDKEGTSNGELTFWFKNKTTVDPNTPVLVKTTAAKEGLSIAGLTISKTDDTLFELDENNPEGSKSYGFIQATSVTDIDSDPDSFTVYGVAASGNKFQPASSKAKFPAFRMVVYCPKTNTNAPRKIRYLDLYGNEIEENVEVGVDSVFEDGEPETISLEVVAGQGEILFTSDADFGKVPVYNLHGGVAAMANVVEGTTAVSLEKGVYIVMGKKYMVK